MPLRTEEGKRRAQGADLGPFENQCLHRKLLAAVYTPHFATFIDLLFIP